MGPIWVGGYLASRLAWSIAVVAAILIVGFLLTHALPGGPVEALVGQFPAPPAYVAQIRRDFGLDKPLPVQFALYLSNVVRGNFGYSFADQQPVLPLVIAKSWTSLSLMVPALVVSSLLGVAMGVLAARRPSGIFATLSGAVSVFGYSVPVFWLGQVLIVVFAVTLGWLPAQGSISIQAVGSLSGTDYLDYLRHLVLPGFCVAIYYLGIVARVARASLLDTVQEDFVLTARAKGMSALVIWIRHVLPNALIPVITVIGYNFSYALTGAVLVETVFGWPGAGNLFITSIANRDYPVIEAIFLVSALAVVVVNLLTDLAYGVIDPRVRQSGATT